MLALPAALETEPHVQAWHDENASAALETRLVTNMPKIQGATGSKMGFIINNIGTATAP